MSHKYYDTCIYLEMSVHNAKTQKQTTQKCDRSEYVTTILVRDNGNDISFDFMTNALHTLGQAT